MTREEAIQILADLIDSPFLHTWEKQNKALHMAIEALSVDTVSREHHDMEVKELKHQIKDQADMVSVVRCKDCRWWNSETKGCKRNSSVEAWYETDFCSYGERQCNYFGERREE